jgi:hypothetical protein
MKAQTTTCSWLNEPAGLLGLLASAAWRSLLLRRPAGKRAKLPSLAARAAVAAAGLPLLMLRAVRCRWAAAFRAISNASLASMAGRPRGLHGPTRID